MLPSSALHSSTVQHLLELVISFLGENISLKLYLNANIPWVEGKYHIIWTKRVNRTDLFQHLLKVFVIEK